MNRELERRVFENWLKSTSGWRTCAERNMPFSLRQYADGNYRDFRVNDRWLAWLARASYHPY
jgi:hypothetical protein